MALDIYSDLSEQLNYNFVDFPLYIRKGALSHFDKYTVACHWHPDLEFILVLSGEMEYFVNGIIQHLKTNEGIFVNSKRLHYNYSQDNDDCSFIVVAIHPLLLGNSTLAIKKYMEEKFTSATSDFIHLTAETEWQDRILEDIKSIYNDINGNNRDLLNLLSKTISLCSQIATNIEETDTNVSNSQVWPLIWNMTNFIHQKYSSKITIDDIASAGSVCRSKCCEIFKKYIGQTPNTYLTHHRIYESSKMLKESNRSIIEIALTCGFQNASYFAQVFHKETGFTPKEYRQSIC